MQSLVSHFLNTMEIAPEKIFLIIYLADSNISRLIQFRVDSITRIIYTMPGRNKDEESLNTV